MAKKKKYDSFDDFIEGEGLVEHETEKLVARTPNQKVLIKSINSLDIVLCHGPAGCGKSYITSALAYEHLRKNKVKRIIVTRPAITVDEDLGFLPGNLAEKIDPYLVPIYSNLQKWMTPYEFQRAVAEKTIEAVPFAVMRGRDFEDAFIYCDEVQGVTFHQLKTLMTRMGQGSKMVLTGDPTQSDLHYRDRGASQYLAEILMEDKDAAVITMEHSDIQRHPIVGKILAKWDKGLENFQQKTRIERTQALRFDSVPY